MLSSSSVIDQKAASKACYRKPGKRNFACPTYFGKRHCWRPSNGVAEDHIWLGISQNTGHKAPESEDIALRRLIGIGHGSTAYSVRPQQAGTNKAPSNSTVSYDDSPKCARTEFRFQMRQIVASGGVSDPPLFQGLELV
jgi:hypothetical protein